MSNDNLKVNDEGDALQSQGPRSPASTGPNAQAPAAGRSPSIAIAPTREARASFAKLVRRIRARRWSKANPIAERLQRKLIRMGYDVHIPQRQYPGHWERSRGAWVWSAKRVKGLFDIGSTYTMRRCLAMTDEELLREMIGDAGGGINAKEHAKPDFRVSDRSQVAHSDEGARTTGGERGPDEGGETPNT